MLRITFLFLFIVGLSSCKPIPKTVLVVGDSWAFLTCVYKSLDKALLSAGVQEAGTNQDCALTSIVGAEAREWLKTPQHKQALRVLKNPSVQVIYISLGGNDVINQWNKDMNPQQESELISSVRKNLTEIVDVYRKIRPDVRILVSGYDYPRFIPNHPVPNYAEAFEQMGSPRPSEINRALVVMSEQLLRLSEIPNTAFVHHLGLMHYHYGHFESGLQPGTTKPPSKISKPGEFLNTYGGVTGLSSDASAMEILLNGAVVDAFHLSEQGFLFMADHSVQQYLGGWLK